MRRKNTVYFTFLEKCRTAAVRYSAAKPAIRRAWGYSTSRPRPLIYTSLTTVTK